MDSVAGLRSLVQPARAKSLLVACACERVVVPRRARCWPRIRRRSRCRAPLQLRLPK